MIRFFGLVMFVLLLFSCAKEKSVDTMGDNPTLPPPASTDTCLLTRFVQGTHVGDDTILRISYNVQKKKVWTQWEIILLYHHPPLLIPAC